MTEVQHDSANRNKKSPQEIEAEISQTRSAITEDIKALGDKLSPESLKQGAKEVLRDAKEEASDMLRTAKDHAIESVTETVSELGHRARQAGHVTGDFVSANAIPLALIGIGAGWLALTMRHHRMQSDRYLRPGWQEGPDAWELRKRRVESRAHELADRAKSSAHDLADKAVGTAHDIADKAKASAHDLRDLSGEALTAVRTRVQETAGDISHRAGDLAHQAQEQFSLAQRRSIEFAEENPVAVGALAALAGVGVGLLLPMTTPENRLMGPARDRLVGEARQTAERVGRTAREAVGDLREAISEPAMR